MGDVAGALGGPGGGLTHPEPVAASGRQEGEVVQLECPEAPGGTPPEGAM